MMVDETPSVTPIDAPVRAPGRLQIGLNFWTPLLFVVALSIFLLLVFLTINELVGSARVDAMYQLGISLGDSKQPLDSDRIRELHSLANDAKEHHQAFRMFWLQAAQLILLNLFLPIIAALLGYIFGAQQPRSDD
jgi:hypothetical protein